MGVEIVSLAEIQLASGTLFEGTVEGETDASGNTYTGRLQAHPTIERALSHGDHGVVLPGRVSLELAALQQPPATAVPAADSIVPLAASSAATGAWGAAPAPFEVSIPDKPDRIAVALVSAVYSTADADDYGVPSAVHLTNGITAQAFTKVAHITTTFGGTRISVSLWYLLAPWHNAQVKPGNVLKVAPTAPTLTSGAYTLNVAVLTHAAQEAPEASGTATTNSLAVTSVADGALRVDGLANDRIVGAGPAPAAADEAAGLARDSLAQSAAGTAALAFWPQPAAGAMTGDWTESGASAWAMVGAVFKPRARGALTRPPAAANELAATFRATEPRGQTVILYRKDRVSDTVTTRFTGQIEGVQYTGRTIRLELGELRGGLLERDTPLQRITAAAYPNASGPAVDLDATVPVHLGAHREHTPCRYIEEDFVRDRFLFVVGGVLALGDVVQIGPRVNDLYLGTQTGAARLGAGEFSVLVDAPLVDVEADDITLTEGASASGSFTQSQSIDYQVIAWNGVHRTKGWTKTIIIAGTGGRGVTIAWAHANLHCTGYEVHRDGALLVRRHGGHFTQYVDNGSRTPDSAYPPATVNSTGTWALCVRFWNVPYAASSALAPVLADVETTELAVEADTLALWLFRGDFLDQSLNRNHLLEANVGTVVAYWVFDTGATDYVRSLHTASTENRLTGTFIDASHYHEGQHGRSCWGLHGSAAVYWSLAFGSQVNLAPGTGGHFQVTAKIFPGPTGGTQVIVSNLGGRGWVFSVTGGRLTVFLTDGSLGFTIVGTTRLDRAWHVVSFEVDRVADECALTVDGVVEAVGDITGLGSLTSTGLSPLLVGKVELADPGVFGGRIEWIRCLFNLVTPLPTPNANFVHGKANQGLNAAQFDGTQPSLQIRHDRQTGLDQTTGDFSIEGWIYLTDTPAGSGTEGGDVPLCGKDDISSVAGGYVLGFLNADRKLRLALREAGVGIADVVTAPNAIALNTWTYFYAGVERESGGAAGVLTLDIDGTVTTAAISAGTPYSLTNTQPFHIAWYHTNQFDDGYLDELRVNSGTRTAAQRREARRAGQRNPVRQVRQFLEADTHGPGLTLDSTTWDAAEDTLAALEGGALVTGLAFVEIAPLGDHIAQLLRLRGMRLAQTAAGAWTITVDTQQTPAGVFARADQEWENAAPVWTLRALRDAPESLEVAFRRRRFDVGQVDRFLVTTTPRTVLAGGEGDILRIELAALRDITAADIVADYLAAREVLRDQTVEFEVGEDGLALEPGDVITVKDITTGIASQAVEVRSIRERGPVVTVAGNLWDSGLYTYGAETLPDDPHPESSADFEATIPPAVTALAATITTVFSTDDSRVALTWTDPASANFVTIMIAWKYSSETANWRDVGSVERGVGEFTFQIDITDTIDIRVQTANAFGLRSPPTTLLEQS